jgi:hypothetical protein
VTWKFKGRGEKRRGIPIETYDLSGPMRISRRCEIADLAFEIGLSEAEFHGRYDPMEKAQLLATYRSKAKRELVVVKYPVKE